MSETIRRIVLPILLIVSNRFETEVSYYHSYIMKFSRFRFRLTRNISMITPKRYLVKHFFNFLTSFLKCMSVICDSFINISPLPNNVNPKNYFFHNFFLKVFCCSFSGQIPYIIYNRKKAQNTPFRALISLHSSNAKKHMF